MSFAPPPARIADEDLARLKQDRHVLEFALAEAGVLLQEHPTTITGDACRCPFHRDENPSGSLHRDPTGRTWLYTCHGCPTNGNAWNNLNPDKPSNSGDAIAVLRAAHRRMGSDLTFSDACERLLGASARRDGSPGADLPAPTVEAPERAKNARDEALAAHHALVSSPELLEQLWKSRAVDIDTVKRFSVGHLESGGRRWWTFPIHTADGTFMALKMHAIDGQSPKSRWYPAGAKTGTPLFPIHLEPDPTVFLCPGELKALAVASLGLAAVGWTCGESVTGIPDELPRLLANRMVVVPADHDDAGRKWAANIVEQLRSANVPCKVLELDLTEPGADIGDWIVSQCITAGSSADDVAAELARRAFIGIGNTPRESGAASSNADQVAAPEPLLRRIGDIWSDPNTWKPVQRVATCINPLDAALQGGYTTGGIHLIAGKPGNCKTQLATQIAVNAARHGTPTALFSLEMSAADIARLSLCQLSGVGRTRIDNGIRDIADAGVAEDVKQAIRGFHDLPLSIVDAEQFELGCSRLDVRDVIAEGVQQFGWKLVVLDHFGELAPAANDPAGAALDIDKANAAILRQAARRHDVALLVVTPLRKAANFKDVAKGNVSLDDVLGSAAIGYAVHTCVAVRADFGDGNLNSYVDLRFLKNRKGPLPTEPLQLRWDAISGRIR